jgi:hypothetical protein
MQRSNGAALSAAAATAGFLVVLLTTALGAAPAAALPPVTGSGCTTSWVNNAAAMACFIQGEEDAGKGVAHPHYVACVPNGGTIYCCVDNDAGNQNCEAVSDVRRSTEAQRIQAILGANRTLLKSLHRYSSPTAPIQNGVPKAADHAP